MLKYPRTPHLEGSRWQPGDEGLEGIARSQLAGRDLVIEEKLDGANAALSFDEGGELRLQSRGHYLTGGHRERHFALFKTWANCHRASLFDRLGKRFRVYGEWLYAKHTVFYDRLPHFFLEFDVFDHEREEFLSTPRRRELLEGLPIASVPVLREGLDDGQDLMSWVRPSLYKGPTWREQLDASAGGAGLDPARCRRETDSSDLAEGLYLKVEEGGRVTQRCKFVRASFLTAVQDSESHWLDRPIVPNRLAPGVDIYAL